jgi:hypothetical protein
VRRTRQNVLEPRAARTRLSGSVLALILLPNGRQLNARIHQLSITGGVLQIANPLDESIAVELAFHVGKNTVRTKVEMLFPMWATQGCLQPFRFVALSDEDRAKLDKSLQSLVQPPLAAAATNSGTS